MGDFAHDGIRDAEEISNGLRGCVGGGRAFGGEKEDDCKEKNGENEPPMFFDKIHMVILA